MKYLLIVLLAAFVTSCGNVGEDLTKGLVKAKVVKDIFTDTYDVQIKYIDPMYSVGDKVTLNGTLYRIVDIDNKLGNLHDYQLEINEDTIIVYDMDRLVGTLHWEDSTELGQLLLKDNE